MTKKIGIDIDEILANTLESILVYYNEIHKTSYKREDFATYNYWETWGGTKDEAIAFVRSFFETENLYKIPPISGAYEELLKLKNLGYKFFAVTGRSSKYEIQTLEWISKYYPNIFLGTYFTHYLNVDCATTKKSDICKQLGIDILVEDDEYHISDCANAGIKVIFLDCPWNKKVNFKNATRVFSWKEISEKIKELSI